MGCGRRRWPGLIGALAMIGTGPAAVLATPIGFELELSGDHDAPTLQIRNTSAEAPIVGIHIGVISPNTFDRLNVVALPPGVGVVAPDPDQVDGDRRSNTLGIGVVLQPGQSGTFAIELDPGDFEGEVDYRTLFFDVFDTNPNPNSEIMVGFGTRGFNVVMRLPDLPVNDADVYVVTFAGDLPAPPPPVPEPSSLALAGIGGLSLIGSRWWRSRGHRPQPTGA